MNPIFLLIQRPAYTAANGKKIRSHNPVPWKKEMEALPANEADLPYKQLYIMQSISLLQFISLCPVQNSACWQKEGIKKAHIQICST